MDQTQRIEADIPVLYVPSGTVAEMIARRMTTLAGLAMTAALVLTGCGNATSTSPVDLQKTLEKAKSWEVAAVWTWAADSEIPMRMTGRGTWEESGAKRTWLNAWNGTSTLAVIAGDQVTLEDGTVLDLTSEKGRLRVAGDLFTAADPLTMAALYDVRLRGQEGRLSGRGNCGTKDEQCLMRLNVELDPDGLPTEVTLVVTRENGSDKITYRYNNIVA